MTVGSHQDAHASAVCFARKRKQAYPQLIISQLRVGLFDGLCCRSHTDTQPVHGEALVADEVVVLSVVFHGGPGPVGDFVVFVRHQGFNAAATIVVVALRRPVLSRGPLPQAAVLRDRPGQVGNLRNCEMLRFSLTASKSAACKSAMLGLLPMRVLLRSAGRTGYEPATSHGRCPQTTIDIVHVPGSAPSAVHPREFPIRRS